MYLYRVTLDPRGHQARRDLGDAYEMHRTLTRAFAADTHQPPQRFLWRLESGPDGWQQPQLLVQSACAGDWTPIQQLPNYLKKPVETKTFDPVLWLQNRERCRFRLLANPTVTHQGKRFGLHAETDQIAWLARQGERHGFRPEVAMVVGTEKLSTRKGERPITIVRTRFEGHLVITDSDALAAALANGIGPAKAFGCGLLSLGSA